MFSLYRIVLAFIFILSSQEIIAQEISIEKKKIKSVNAKTIDVNKLILSNKACIFIYYSPECPICLSQTKTLNELYSAYPGDSIKFVLIFPGTYYSKKTIKKFLLDYSLRQYAIIDKHFTLTKMMKATVTPEAIVVNAGAKIVYAGKINNSFEQVGKRRAIVTEQYLKDAIDATLQNQLPLVKRTEPVGCLLNYNH